MGLPAKNHLVPIAKDAPVRGTYFLMLNYPHERYLVFIAVYRAKFDAPHNLFRGEVPYFQLLPFPKMLALGRSRRRL